MPFKDRKRAEELSKSSSDGQRHSNKDPYSGYTYGDGHNNTPSYGEDFFVQQKQRQREDLRRTLTGDSPLRLKGGAPKSQYAELIKQAVENAGHTYTDVLSAKSKKRRNEACTEKEVKALSYYN